jgi:hypothetical protein
MQDSGTLQRVVEQRLVAAGFPMTTIAATVNGSTVLLTGAIVNASVRGPIVDSLLELSAVDRVVDAMTVGQDSASPKIFLKPGASLSRAFKDLFDPNVTWK